MPKEEKEIDDLINKIKLFGKIEQNIKKQIPIEEEDDLGLGDLFNYKFQKY